MDCYVIKNLSFAYPNTDSCALSDISLEIKDGEFLTLCGRSGCGKTTLLRLLKPELAPSGNISGEIYFDGEPLLSLSKRNAAEKIGLVMQNPDNQLVTDKVWHELAFGLESLGCPQGEIRTRVSETASFFGIQNWFHKKVNELSGGQKQILNLASVMVMQPKVLLLDEPTASLDPIAAGEFLKAVERINREIGTTVIISEHRLDDVLPISDRVIVLDNGKINVCAPPQAAAAELKKKDNAMYGAFPVPMRVYETVDGGKDCPVTVRQGRQWLLEFAAAHTPHSEKLFSEKEIKSGETVLEMRDVHFRYEKNQQDIVNGINLKINRGELFAILGGNGTGKTTALSLMSGQNKPRRGKVLIQGRPIGEINGLYDGILGLLPQNPQTLFVKNTVKAELWDMIKDKKSDCGQAEEKINEVARLCEITKLLNSHPYDLSGGEMQRTALAKLLLLSPEILLLDEPTNGLDVHFKKIFADILIKLTKMGVTIIMVSHDIEFCARYAHRCAMFFDGSVTACAPPRTFFKNNSFYTTAARRMSRGVLDNILLEEDIAALFNQKPADKIGQGGSSDGKSLKALLADAERADDSTPSEIDNTDESDCFKAVHSDAPTGTRTMTSCEKMNQNHVNYTKKNTKKLTAVSLAVAAAAALTVFFGMKFFGDRKYYFISMLIILETMLPFALLFEHRKPRAREIVLISVLCAIAVGGRAAFFMLPQFKPVAAIVIISGVCLGGETGFLVGAVSAFVSNFFFGQGPWTPWQMLAFGLVGLFAGMLNVCQILKKKKIPLCIFGFLASAFLCGGILNASSVLMYQSEPTAAMMISSMLTGLPFDLIHGVSTVIFLWLISSPMIEKLDRVKIKYGIYEKSLTSGQI